MDENFTERQRDRSWLRWLTIFYGCKIRFLDETSEKKERERSFTLGCWQLANFCRFVFLWLVFSFCCILLKCVFLTTFFLVVAFCWSMWCIIFIIKLGSSLLKCNFFGWIASVFLVLLFSVFVVQVFYIVKFVVNICILFLLCLLWKITMIFIYFSHVLANSLYIVFHWSMGCIIVFLLCVIVHQSATS